LVLTFNGLEELGMVSIEKSNTSASSKREGKNSLMKTMGSSALRLTTE